MFKQPRSWFSRALGLTLALFSGVFLGACAPDPPTQLVAPDNTRTGELGELGTWGAFLHERTFRVRVDESVDTDIIVPSINGDVPAEAPFPPVIFVQGGFVDASRYRWLGAHIASRGFTVIAPHLALPSLLQQGDIFDAFQAVRAAAQNPDDPLANAIDLHAPAMVMGHSVGGVSAAKLWASQPEDTTHLVLICSTTDTTDDYSTRPISSSNERVLSVIGSADIRVPEQDARDGLVTFKVPITFAAVEGMIHYHVVEDPTESELSTDGTPTIDAEQARKLTSFLVDAMLEDFAGGGSNVLDEPDAWSAGLLPVAR